MEALLASLALKVNLLVYLHFHWLWAGLFAVFRVPERHRDIGIVSDKLVVGKVGEAQFSVDLEFA